MLKPVHNIKNSSFIVPGRPQKNGYLYIHYHNLDAIHNIAGFNATRIMRRKNPYPVLVATEAEKNALLSVREYIRTSVSPISQGTTARQSMMIVDIYKIGKSLIQNNQSVPQPLETKQKIFIAVYRAVENLEVSVGLSNLGINDKLYLLGHGSGGVDIVGSIDDSAYNCTMQQYAQILQDNNLSKQIRDLRAVWCESANHQSTLKRVILPPLKMQWPQANFSDVLSIIPAQALSTALARIGYRDIEVHGYQGFSAIYPEEVSSPEFFKRRYMQVTEVHKMISDNPFDVQQMERREDMRRASTVRKTYRNGYEVKRC